VGADIEGQMLAGEDFIFYTQEQTRNVQNLGSVTVDDIRKPIDESARQLTFGMQPNTQPSTIPRLEENTPEVLYFEGQNVVLGTVGQTITVEGEHTILIKNGNLLIRSDLEYAHPESSLGVILLNDSPYSNYPVGEDRGSQNQGNLFVHKDVQKLVGTYYADGPILTTQVVQPEAAWTLSDTEDHQARLDPDPENGFTRQLILEGGLFTRNTLGGSWFIEDVIESHQLRDPWGVPIGDGSYAAENLDIAYVYDLHFVRRYTPVVHPQNCTRDTQGNCDPNPHSFVIRPDGRVKYNPPPGFTQVQSLE
jgi:hypothetical protein